MVRGRFYIRATHFPPSLRQNFPSLVAPRHSLTVGTRGSRLALAQAERVCALLREKVGDTLDLQLEIVRTEGDRSRGPLSEIGGQGVFTAELETALRDGRVDLAVHSLKDLPTAVPADLELAAAPARADVRDVLVTAGDRSLEELPGGALLGTGSPRRRAQLLALRPDLRFADIRGNVDTRIDKVGADGLDGVVLAAAGLQRLGLLDRISSYLDTDEMLPAPGQGVLGLQMRRGDPRRGLVAELNHGPTRAGAAAERSLLHALGAGCRAPVAAWGREISGELLLDGLVASADGSELLRRAGEGYPDAADILGRDQAAELLEAGADRLLERAGGKDTASP